LTIEIDRRDIMKMRTIMMLGMLLVATGAVAQQPNQERVICELSSGNCVRQADLIQKRIKKLNRKIKENQGKYSPEELKKLEQKLKETQELLDKLESGK
jgi:Skp family chaperone for outer membrane proteins